MGILTGYRVLDCSIAMAGPFAAQRLGDLGAEVIKVEPVTGEWQRHVAAGGAKGNEINVSFLSLNRNKKSIAINLKSEEGLKVLKDLVASADVFLQNYRPGVAKRLGVDYETLKSYKIAISRVYKYHKKQYPKNYTSPGISKMWSAFFVLSILPEILRISFRFQFY